MTLTRRDIIVALVVFIGLGTLFSVGALATRSHAQGVKMLQAQVTAELNVPGWGNVRRFEDPDYKIICYAQVGGYGLSCVKR